MLNISKIVMRTRLIDSNFDKEDDTSFATIQTYRGEYTGYSSISKEDEDIVSGFIGCEKAEMKAVKKFLMDEKRDRKVSIKTLKDFYKNLQCSNKFDKDSYFAKRLRKEIERYEKEQQELEEDINILVKGIKHTDHFRLMKKRIDDFVKKNKKDESN